MMNILIGVLSESYLRGFEVKERLFWLERARVVSIYFAVQAAVWKERCHLVYLARS